MPKIIPSQTSKTDTDKMLRLLYSKIAKLKTPYAVSSFISDLLTESEKIMILRRLQIAKFLLENSTYREIRDKLDVGIDTIKNVRKNLDSGRGGYINFIKKL